MKFHTSALDKELQKSKEQRKSLENTPHIRTIKRANGFLKPKIPKNNKGSKNKIRAELKKKIHNLVPVENKDKK